MGIVLHTLAALGYALLAWHPWRALAAHAGTLATPLEKGLLGGVLVLHAAALYTSMASDGALRLGLGLAISATLWLGMLVYWVESLIIRVDGIRLLLLPLAAVAALAPVALPDSARILYTGTPWLATHLTVSLAAYAMMTIAAMHALLMAAADRRLHSPTPSAVNPGLSRTWAQLLDTLPPLLVLEQVLFRVIGIGFVLLTLAMLSGAAMSQAMNGSWLPFDHKTIFTLLSWATFGVLLLGRWLRGWRGRLAIRYTLAGLILLLLAYAGSRFVLEFIIER